MAWTILTCPQYNVKSMYNLTFSSVAVTADSKFVSSVPYQPCKIWHFI